jgi:uncharacterized damage-inducible protein DinB
MRLISKPNPDEYPAYAKMYIDLLPDDGQLLEHLTAGYRATGELLRFLPEDRLLYRYAEGKWTIKEVLLHVVDDERIYAYRALRFARDDKTELPGFEQDDYVPVSGANERSIEDLLCELEAVRQATIQLYRGLPEEALLRSGIANGNRASVRALGYHIAGHEAHHLRLIRERYLKTE